MYCVVYIRTLYILLRYLKRTCKDLVYLKKKKKEKMPFISKDWRSPGEEWVKYEGGWEKKSIVTTVDIASTSPKEHLISILTNSCTISSNFETKAVSFEVISKRLCSSHGNVLIN